MFIILREYCIIASMQMPLLTHTWHIADASDPLVCWCWRSRGVIEHTKEEQKTAARLPYNCKHYAGDCVAVGCEFDLLQSLVIFLLCKLLNIIINLVARPRR